jgi:hypothetical protein
MNTMTLKLLRNGRNSIVLVPRYTHRRTELSVGHSALCLSLATFILLTLGMMTASAQLHLDAQLGPGMVYQGNWPSSPNYAYDVKVAEPYAYVALLHGGLAVLNVSNPTNLVCVGGYAKNNYYARDVAMAGNYAYLLDVDAGFQVIDVSNPTNCVLVGGYRSGADGYHFGIAVAGCYAYVALDSRGWSFKQGLQIFDVSNPTNCILVGGYGTNWTANGLAVAGNYAYLAADWRGLQVIDVSNPTNCVWVGSCSNAPSGTAFGVVVAGHYAYVVDGSAGLQVIDVSDPIHCVQVGGYDTIGNAKHVAVSGHYAYVGDGSVGGLQVIDVSDPTNCMWVGGYDTSGIALGVAVANNRMYVADYNSGVQVLDWLPDAQFTVRVDALTNAAFTIEACTNLANPSQWTPLLTTNVATMPFDYVDHDAMTEACPQKFYRVHQP